MKLARAKLMAIKEIAELTAHSDPTMAKILGIIVEFGESKELVDQANELARQVYLAEGCNVPEGYRFDKARHPQEVGCWNLAVMMFDHFESIDVDTALSEIEEDDDESVQT